MALKQHFKALLLAFVALALTVTGVVIAATDSNPGAAVHDPLSLRGYPPKTANLLLTINDGKGFGITSNIGVNFNTNAIQANVLIPIAITSADINVMVVGGHVYLRTGAASSGKWFAYPAKLPALFGFALELTKPDISLIKGFPSGTIVTSGPYTTYIYTKKNVPLGSALSSGIATASDDSTLGSVTLSITVGATGEVTAASAAFATRHSHTTLSVKVLSYNKPVSITKPETSDVTSISPKYIQNLLKGGTGKNFLIPTNLGSFSSTSVKTFSQ